MQLLRVDLTQSPPAVVADAAPWAANVQANLPPSVWPDLTPCGYPGVGYWPVVVITPAYNPLTEVLGAETQVIDATNKQILQSWIVVPLHSAALAVAQNYVTRLNGQAVVLDRRGKFVLANALRLKALGVQING